MPVYFISLSGAEPAGLTKFPLISKLLTETDPVLKLLNQVHLFDFMDDRNYVALPSHYEMAERLDSFDSGPAHVLLQIRESEAFQNATVKAQSALASGDIDRAKILLTPFEAAVSQLQGVMRAALIKGDLFMFYPEFPTEFR